MNCTWLRYMLITAVTGALVAMTTVDASEPRSAANGLVTTVLFTYTTYTLQSGGRLVVAAITAFMLGVLHIALAIALNSVHHQHTIPQASYISLPSLNPSITSSPKTHDSNPLKIAESVHI